MSEGWGQDFDEDGNVIGEVPEKEEMLLVRHKYKFAAIAVFWFLVAALGDPSGGPGHYIGAAVGSAVVAAALVAGGAWMYKKTA